MARPGLREMRHATKRRKASRCRRAGAMSFCFGRPRELLALARLLPARPLGQRFPVRVVLGLELPAAVMEGVAARFGRERHDQKAARGKVAGNHQSGDRFEVAAGLLLGPGLGSWREPLPTGGGVGLSVTYKTNGGARGPPRRFFYPWRHKNPPLYS